MAFQNRTLRQLWTQESDGAPPLMVATVAEDDIAASSAQRLIGRILHLSGHAMPVEAHNWNFAAFDKPDGMAATARRASTADVLVIAAYSDTPAAKRVCEWLKHWVAPRRNKHAALVFVGIERPETVRPRDPVEDQLAIIAHQIGMDFFATSVPASSVPASRKPGEGDPAIH